MMKKLLLVALALGGLSLVPSVEAGRCRTKCKPAKCATRCKPQKCEERVVGQNVYPCCKKEVIEIPGYTCCDVIETCCKTERCGVPCAPVYQGDAGYDQAKANRVGQDSMSSAE